MKQGNATSATHSGAGLAMVWKELRENARWAAALVLISGGVVYALRQAQLYPSISNYYRAESLTTYVFQMVTVVGSAGAALLLGVMQTLPERRPDAWHCWCIVQ